MTLTIERKIGFERRGRGARKEMRPATPVAAQRGRVPRISKLMALAIRFDELIRGGTVADYAELAQLGHVSRARITQIMNLLMLAPDIQGALLHLSRVVTGADPIHLKEVLPIAAISDWDEQRMKWQGLVCT